MENGSVVPRGSNFQSQITLGNVISWVVMVATMGMIWGTLSENVKQNTVVNDRQDLTIAVLKDAVADLRVDIATGNGDLRLIRELLQRAEQRTR